MYCNPGKRERKLNLPTMTFRNTLALVATLVTPLVAQNGQFPDCAQGPVSAMATGELLYRPLIVLGSLRRTAYVTRA